MVEGKSHHRTRFERDPTTHHGAKTELRSLQIGQNPNGPRQGTLDVADRLHIAGKGSVIGMTHIDTENIDARFAQAANQVWLPRSRPQGCDDFHTAAAAHALSITQLAKSTQRAMRAADVRTFGCSGRVDVYIRRVCHTHQSLYRRVEEVGNNTT